MAESQVTREVSGRWVPAVPLRAPVDVRWACDHRWTPHVHDNGMTSHVDYDCLRCAATTEAATRPDDGPWPIRSWIAERVWWKRRRRKAREPDREARCG